MKQFAKVFVNELIKLWRRTTVKVLIAISLLIAVLAPIANLELSNDWRFDFNDVFTDYFLSEFPSVQKARDRALELGIESGEWRMKLLSQIVDNCRYLDYSDMKTIPFDNDELEYLKSLREENEFLWKLIEENDFKRYISEAREAAENGVALYAREAEEALKTLAADPGSKMSEAEKAQALELSDRFVKIIETIEKAFDAALKGNMKGTAADTRIIDYLADTAAGRGFEAQISDIVFDRRSDLLSPLLTGEYEELLKTADEDSKALLEKVSVAEYAISNGKDEMTTAQSVRYKMLSLVTGAFYGMLILLGIYAASSAVAAEFSRKTVNMLVIRPVSRSKIVIAKFTAVLAVVYSTAFAGIVLGALFSSIANGFGDLFQPYIYWNGTSAAEFPYLIWYLWRALVASLNIVFYVSLSFCMAMLIRHTTGSMVVSYSMYAFSSVLNLIRYSLLVRIAENTGEQIYSYLPLSYLDYRSGIFNDVPRLFGRISLDNIEQYIYSMFSGLHGLGLLYGAAMLSAMCVILYFIANRSFNKRDIKS